MVTHGWLFLLALLGASILLGGWTVSAANTVALPMKQLRTARVKFTTDDHPEFRICNKCACSILTAYVSELQWKLVFTNKKTGCNVCGETDNYNCNKETLVATDERSWPLPPSGELELTVARCSGNWFLWRPDYRYDVVSVAAGDDSDTLAIWSGGLALEAKHSDAADVASCDTYPVNTARPQSIDESADELDPGEGETTTVTFAEGHLPLSQGLPVPDEGVLAGALCKVIEGAEAAHLIKDGSKVVRGTDWIWGDQDGGPGSEGRALRRVNEDGWAWVVWGNREDNHYRMGAEGKYDLALLVDESPPDQSSDTSDARSVPLPSQAQELCFTERLRHQLSELGLEDVLSAHR